MGWILYRIFLKIINGENIEEKIFLQDITTDAIFYFK